MVTALQCPSCDHRHALGPRASGETFRCESCGRLLKVPASVAAPPAASTRDAPTQAVARVPPSERTITDDGARRRPPTARVPRFLRLLVWMVALPLGLLVVGAAGRAAGLLTIGQAVDVFVGAGWSRFVPPLLVLPVWAGVTAALAHVLSEALGRLLRRH